MLKFSSSNFTYSNGSDTEMLCMKKKAINKDDNNNNILTYSGIGFSKGNHKHHTSDKKSTSTASNSEHSGCLDTSPSLYITYFLRH